MMAKEMEMFSFKKALPEIHQWAQFAHAQGRMREMTLDDGFRLGLTAEIPFEQMLIWSSDDQWFKDQGKLDVCVTPSGGCNVFLGAHHAVLEWTTGEVLGMEEAEAEPVAEDMSDAAFVVEAHEYKTATPERRAHLDAKWGVRADYFTVELNKAEPMVALNKADTLAAMTTNGIDPICKALAMKYNRDTLHAIANAARLHNAQVMKAAREALTVKQQIKLAKESGAFMVLAQAIEQILGYQE
jgi:hypothetical protein